jgi:predicted CoA-substrate-specific enzyme activase
MPPARRPERTIDPNGGPFFCGVDVGAAATKLVLIDAAAAVRARAVRPSGVDYTATAGFCLDQALGEAGATAAQIGGCVATGYGRGNVAFARTRRTEIHCHGVGCHHLLPGALTILDIGGQDNKVIRLAETGRRVEFKMNRKCAAGTGAFLEEIAVRLDLPLAEMDRLARSSDRTVRLSSFCTVFAKTEILAHLRRGVPVAEIVRGAFESVVTRVLEMDALAGDVVVTGGVVAYNGVVADLLAEKLDRPIAVPEYPQFTGALGAALVARHDAGQDPQTGPDAAAADGRRDRS